MVAAIMAFRSGLDIPLCFNRDIFRQGFFDGMAKKDRFRGCSAVYFESDFQFCFYAFAVRAQKQYFSGD